jgi:hypothetical protein
VSTLHRFFGIRDYILRVLTCSFIYLVANSLCQQLFVAQWLSCWVVMLRTRVRVPACAVFFYNHVYNGYYGDHNISLLSSFCIFCFLSSFVHIPEREGAVGFSTCYDGNCLLLRNTCSKCLIVNLTTSFHIVVQMFVCARKPNIKGNRVIYTYGHQSYDLLYICTLIVDNFKTKRLPFTISI